MAIALPHPRTNPQLFGFTHTEDGLARAFHGGKLHHSLLITGAKGIGKATLAYRFARFIFSGGADLRAIDTDNFSLFGAPEPSAEITSGEGALYMPESHGIFRRTANNSHADLLSIEPAYDEKKGVYKDEIQADAARKISDFLSLTPAESTHRVVVIDAADQLNEKAANALLKSIEEPPAHTFILLICHNPLSILATIRSRCRNIKLSTPDLAAFGAVLSQRMPTIDMSDYGALHTLSQGSAGFAMQLSAFGAVELYEILARQLAKPTNLADTLTLAAELSASKHPQGWAISQYMLMSVIERALNAHVVQHQPIFAGEAEYIKALQARLGQGGLFALRDKMRQLLRDTDTLNLDHTQAMSLLLSAA